MHQHPVHRQKTAARRHHEGLLSHNASFLILTPEPTPRGVDVTEWLKDPESPFKPRPEIRSQAHPPWWYSHNILATGHIKSESYIKCQSFAAKELCWERFDRQRFDREQAAAEANT